MAIDYTSTAMIASIKRRAMLPDTQSLYNDSEICSILSEEMQADLAPLLMSVNEEYFVQNYDQTIDTTVNSYSIPVRAIGVKLRDVVLVNSNGFEISLPRLDPDFLKRQNGDYAYNSSVYLNRPGFFLRDDQVMIFPNTSTLGSFMLRMKYFRRPNNIVEISSAAKISLINTSTKVVTVTSIPTGWTTETTFDLIKGTPSFKSWGDDETITAIDFNAKTLTFSSLPSGLAVNDWICESGMSPIAQIPWETFNLLEQRAVLQILEGMKDTQGLQSASSVYTDMVTKFKILVSPRVDGSPKKIVRSSPLFGGRQNRLGGRW